MNDLPQSQEASSNRLVVYGFAGVFCAALLYKIDVPPIIVLSGLGMPFGTIQSCRIVAALLHRIQSTSYHSNHLSRNDQ